MQCIVRPVAAADLDEAFQWYEGQRAGLGEEVLEAAQTAIAAITKHPERYAVIRRNTRRALLRRFPYCMYYRVYDDIVVVVACMHARRSPRQWQSRT